MKKKIYPTLTTPFSEKMDKDIPWNVYPRPQLKRNSFICLNGLWDFTITKSDKIPENFTEKILVPFPVESKLSGIERRVNKNDRLFYRRTFSLPEGFIADRLLLRFGAIDRFAKIYVNGNAMGVHDCGYTPFFVDVTEAVKDGENEIIVEVRDELSKLYPYGKQKRNRGGMWYTPVSGIWQTVWLESVPEGYVENIRIKPSLESVDIQLFTKSKVKKITLLDSGEVFEFRENFITISPKEVKNWTPENPYLYRFKLETESDTVESYFALRTVTKERVNGIPRLCLNGKPYLFNGLLDQGYFPDGLFLPATPEGYENDIKFAKSLGYNTLRKHIKTEPAIFYYLCDTLGIAVFQDMVNNGRYSFLCDTALPTIGFKRKRDKNRHKNPESREAFIDCMTATANMLYNYPSVVYYTIFNEGWGQFNSDEMYEKLKAQDPSRIIDSTSGWFAQSKSDVASHHVYFKKPALLQDPTRPLVLSEFGGFSYRVEGHLFGAKNYGYSKYKIEREFEKSVFSLYENDVKQLVKNGISALIYTQISDIEDETNGLITYDRRHVKVDTPRMKKILNELFELSVNTEVKNENSDML